MMDTWNTVPMATIRLLQARRQEALMTQQRGQQRRFQLFVLRLCCLLLMLSVALAGWLLLITTPYALHVPDVLAQPTPTHMVYPCARVIFMENASGQVTEASDYTCP